VLAFNINSELEINLTSRGSDVLLRLLCLGAGDGILASLDLQNLGAILASTLGSKTVHGTLQCVTLPAKEVVAMGSKPGTARTILTSLYRGRGRKYSRVSKTIDKWLLAILPVLGVACDHARVIFNLIHDLRDSHRVRAGALVTGERSAGRVGHVALVIWAVQVLPIPAGGEDDSGADAAGAWLAGEGERVTGGTGGAVASHDAFAGRETAVADVGEVVRLIAERGVPGEHTEALVACWVARLCNLRGDSCTYRLEGGHLLVGTTKWSHVVYGKAPLLFKQSPIQATVGHLRDPLECPVLRGLEVNWGRPIVAGVLGVDTAGAGRLCRRINSIWVHLNCSQFIGTERND
jgi:hypothetical protein